MTKNDFLKYAFFSDKLQEECNSLTTNTSKPDKMLSQFYFDICIITATPEEFHAILEKIQTVEQFELPNSESLVYYKGIIKNKERNFNVLLLYPQGMGISAASIAATKLLDFNPKCVFMVGIAAGNKNLTKIGDILIAEKSLNYDEVVEIQRKDGSTSKKFMQNANSINSYLKTKFNIAINQNSSMDEIKQNFRLCTKIKHELKCHLGLMVTGSSLVRSQDKINDINSSYHGVVGLDMETYALYYACTHLKKVNIPYFASIKSVSDFGENTTHDLNSDERKQYALHTSTNFLVHFIKHYLNDI